MNDLPSSPCYRIYVTFPPDDDKWHVGATCGITCRLPLDGGDDAEDDDAFIRRHLHQASLSPVAAAPIANRPTAHSPNHQVTGESTYCIVEQVNNRNSHIPSHLQRSIETAYLIQQPTTAAAAPSNLRCLRRLNAHHSSQQTAAVVQVGRVRDVHRPQHELPGNLFFVFVCFFVCEVFTVSSSFALCMPFFGKVDISTTHTPIEKRIGDNGHDGIGD